MHFKRLRAQAAILFRRAGRQSRMKADDRTEWRVRARGKHAYLVGVATLASA